MKRLSRCQLSFAILVLGVLYFGAGRALFAPPLVQVVKSRTVDFDDWYFGSLLLKAIGFAMLAAVLAASAGAYSLFPPKARMSTVLLGALLVFGMGGVGVIAMSLASRFAPHLPLLSFVGSEDAFTPSVLAIGAIYILFDVTIQELLSRGVALQSFLSMKLSFPVSNLLQSAIFSIAHPRATQSFTQFVFLVCFGYLMGLMATRYRSLAPAIAIHSVVNLVAWGASHV